MGSPIWRSLVALTLMVTPLGILSVNRTAPQLPDQPPPGEVEPPPPITITSLSPAAGPPGTVVTVSGSNFGAESDVLFRFTGLPSSPVSLPATVLNDSQLEFTVPSDASCGAYGVKVKSRIGLGPFAPISVSNELSFTVTEPCTLAPILGALSPISGPPGRVVTVSGANFAPGAEVILQLAESPFTTINVGTTVANSSSLSFTVPGGAVCNYHSVRVSNPGAALPSNSRSFRVQCPSVANWQLRLEKLRSLDEQEGGGDEPYLVAIGFRSRMNTPGSTVTWWSEYLDDDWADNLDTGEERDILEEMGAVPFPDVEMPPFVCAVLDGIDCLVELQFLQPEFMGAVVIAMESDWTSWGRVREAVEERREEIEEAVRVAVEDFFAGTTVPQVIEDLTRGLDLGNRIWSWFNRDDNVGVHVFMFVAVNTDVPDTWMPILGSILNFAPSTASALRERTFQVQFGSGDPKYEVTGSLAWSTTGFTFPTELAPPF